MPHSEQSRKMCKLLHESHERGQFCIQEITFLLLVKLMTCSNFAMETGNSIGCNLMTSALALKFQFTHNVMESQANNSTILIQSFAEYSIQFVSVSEYFYRFMANLQLKTFVSSKCGSDLITIVQVVFNACR